MAIYRKESVESTERASSDLSKNYRLISEFMINFGDSSLNQLVLSKLMKTNYEN
jgi:hypothetical protein